MALFEYRDFSLKNESSAMKITTDSLLLGEWFSLNDDNCNILDIGTGTGIISLIAASRLNGHRFSITGIDIDTASVAEAADNFKASCWNSNLKALNINLKEYLEQYSQKKPDFDILVSNPPFFNNSLYNPDERKAAARHASGLPPEMLIEAAFKLLKPDGKLAVIYPFDEGNRFVVKAAANGLFLCRECFVKNDTSHPSIRLMAEFSKTPPQNGIISQTIILT